MFWPYAFISLSDHQPLNSRSSSLVHLDLAILQHKLGRAALACRKIVAGPGGGRKQNPFQRSTWKWPVLRGATRYTTRNTTHYTVHNTTELLAGRHFGALRLLRNEMKIQVSFFCPDLKCSSWQHFGSVACSVACSVAWVLRVVCSVACGGCHVAHFASCSAVCRWRVKHTGGTIRRTDDGFHPLEVAGDGKKFAKPKI